jgi:hypothetical protein
MQPGNDPSVLALSPTDFALDVATDGVSSLSPSVAVGVLTLL